MKKILIGILLLIGIAGYSQKNLQNIEYFYTSYVIAAYDTGSTFVFHTNIDTSAVQSEWNIYKAFLQTYINDFNYFVYQAKYNATIPYERILLRRGFNQIIINVENLGVSDKAKVTQFIDKIKTLL